jgi:uncharacterized protein
MLILLSPAKNLDFAPPAPEIARSAPLFPAESEKVLAAAKKLTPAKLKKLMGISNALAELNWRRYQEFGQAPGKQAVLAFNGDVYQGLQAKTLRPADLAWAQDRLRILSGDGRQILPQARRRPG